MLTEKAVYHSTTGIQNTFYFNKRIRCKQTTMKQIFVFLIIIALSSCKSKNGYFNGCELEKKLFEYRYIIPLRLDTILNLNEFQKFERAIKDTLEFVSVYGMIYDFENQRFVPNPKTSKNLIIPAFEVIGERTHVDKPRPILTIYLTECDTIEFITKEESIHNDTVISFKDRRTTSMRISSNTSGIQNYLNEFFRLRYSKLNRSKESFPWIYVCINDKYSFNEVFLPVFNILFNSYYNNTLNALKPNEICESDSLKLESIVDSYGFKMFIDDLDFDMARFKKHKNTLCP